MVTILGAKIGDQIFVAHICRSIAVQTLLMVGIELREHLAVGPEECLVLRRHVEHALVDATQEHLRIAANLPPQLAVQHKEQPPCRTVPAKPEVGGQVGQPLNLFGQPGNDP